MVLSSLLFSSRLLLLSSSPPLLTTSTAPFPHLQLMRPCTNQPPLLSLFLPPLSHLLARCVALHCNSLVRSERNCGSTARTKHASWPNVWGLELRLQGQARKLAKRFINFLFPLPPSHPPSLSPLSPSLSPLSVSILSLLRLSPSISNLLPWSSGPRLQPLDRLLSQDRVIQLSNGESPQKTWYRVDN